LLEVAAAVLAVSVAILLVFPVVLVGMDHHLLLLE